MIDADSAILPLFSGRSQMISYLRKNFVQGSDYERCTRTKKHTITVTPSTVGIIAIRKQNRRPNKEAIQAALSYFTGSGATHRVTIKTNIEFDTISVLERAFIMFDPVQQHVVPTIG